MAGRISFILNQAEIARGPVDVQKFLAAAHNLLREKGLILRYGLILPDEWAKFEKAVSEVSHKTLTKGIKGYEFEELRKKSRVKEIMMTLESKLIDNQKVIEREEGVNSRPGWIKKAAIGLAAVVGWGIATANLPNDYVNIGPTTAYAEMTGSIEQIYNSLPSCNDLQNCKKYVEKVNLSNSKGVGFTGKEWSNYYFGNRYGNEIKKILKSDEKINYKEMDQFMTQNRGNISKIIFNFNGYLIIEMKHLGYGIIIPISKETGKYIEAL